MSAIPESSIKKLGIIAGGGLMPARLIHACDDMGIDPFIVAFDGQTDLSVVHGYNHLITRMGAAGQIINTLKSHDIRDLVFIGSIKRPNIREMRPDLRTVLFYARLAARALGDDGLLRAMKGELERDGFRIHGIHQFVPDLLAAVGQMGRHAALPSFDTDIGRAVDVLRATGPLDIGQSAVVQDGVILGIEAAEGTDALIRRCAGLKRAGRGPVLVKLCKSGQDRDLDLPTIGPDTVQAARECGYAGVVVEAGATLVLDPDRVAAIADESGIFVIGIKP